MGLIGSKLWNSLTALSKKDTRICMIGLDSAGKTTILYRFKLGEVVTTVPTIGFNVETLEYRNLKMTMWDVGGQHKIRQLWNYYYEGTNAVIFVVDASDRARISEAKEELEAVVKQQALDKVPVLVFANKQDLPNAMPCAELTEKLGLLDFKNRPWYIQSSCAVTGDGIYEGLDYLSLQLK